MEKKRKQLSLKKLFILAQNFSSDYPKSNQIIPAGEAIIDYLKYVSLHWQD